MTRYEFDKDNFDIKKVTRSFRGILWSALKWFVASASIAVLYYIVVSLFISTGDEKRLRRENKMYEKLYSELVERQELVEDVIKDLQYRDNYIYERIFHTEAPSTDVNMTMGFNPGADDAEGAYVFVYTQNKLDKLTEAAGHVEKNLQAVFSALASGQKPIPPMESPLADLTYAKTGASVGMKLSPFYKVMSQHDGLDLLAGQGDIVLATADGIVKDVIRSGKGLGNVIEIDHGNGYVTRYAHLGNIDVAKGKQVERGMKIGGVGISGKSFAPHLHYEVLKDGKVMDPVNYLFLSLTPKEYAGVAYMSVTTEQSLD